MKKILATLMLIAMIMLSTAALATAASAQDDAYPPNGDPEDEVQEVDVEGAVEVNGGAQLAFTGSSTGQTVKLAFGFVIVGAALVFVAKSRTRDDATI